nr:probable methyltransferase PMT15 [Ipomoea batatas]
MSFAPKRHSPSSSPIRFGERSSCFLIGILASKRLPYPSKAFDMAHCSRCLHSLGPIMVLDRVRKGVVGTGFSPGQPIRWRNLLARVGLGRRKTCEAEQTQIEKVCGQFCAGKNSSEVDDIAIWQKPLQSHGLHFNYRQAATLKKSPMCPTSNDPDYGWVYTDLQTCLTPLPQVVRFEKQVGGGELEKMAKQIKRSARQE